MSRRAWNRAGLLSVSLALLASCAEVPPAPAPPPVVRAAPQDEELNRAVAEHRKLARQAQQSGDLAAAVAQWQILTVLAPHDDAYRGELDAARTLAARRVREQLAEGRAALKGGNADGAAEAMLNVLALDPTNREAAQALRQIDEQRATRIQTARAARAGGTAMAAPSPPRAGSRRQARPEDEARDGYDLEQPLAMLAAGDTVGGLRDLHLFVAANPGDRTARERIGNAVYDRGKELEADGEREQALTLYEEAVSLRGTAAPGWTGRIRALRKSLGDEYAAKGAAAYPRDPSGAVKLWETALRFDPQNAKAAARLIDGRAAHDGGAHAAK
jgi:tetratricopeptide (TPR) repeat protein